MNPPAFSSGGGRPAPGLLLGLVCLTGWMAAALWPAVLESLGLVSYGLTYLDSYAILAALDAVRAGQDPHVANALDPLARWHVYSDWWLALRWLGLGRADNFLVGTAWIAAFALTCWLAVRPRDRREAGWMALLLLSPPVLLAFLRANNDLVIFVLVALAGLAAAGSGWLRQLLGIAILVLATGLKYYPAFAAPVFLWARPRSRLPALVALAVAATGLTLLLVAPQMKRAQFQIGSGVHAMGAPLLGRELGWSDRTSSVVAVAVLGLGAAALARGRFTTGLAVTGSPRERLLAAIGASLLLACFAAGVNYAYRFIFVFFMAVWVWRRATGEGAARELRTARVACGLILVALWADGLLCLACNRFVSLSPETLASIDRPWRAFTQPLHWALMTLFAGWLLEGAWTALKAWRDTRHEPDAA
jgi:hypothetical protein